MRLSALPVHASTMPTATCRASQECQQVTLSDEIVGFDGACVYHDYGNVASIAKVPTDDLGCSLIYRPKDQIKFKNRLILATESYFPNIFYWMKKKAIKSLVSKKT